MRPDTLPRFVLRVFLWIAPCFAAWYVLAPYHAIVTGWFSHVIIDLFEPGIVKSVERSGTDLAFVTRLPVQAADGGKGVLVAEVGPLVYTYGLALFAALMLAARAGWWWKLVLGALALLPFEAWGIAFDFLAQAAVKLGPEVSAQAGLSAGQREAIVFGYQLGALILPPLAPVALWAAFNRRFLEGLLRPAAQQPVA